MKKLGKQLGFYLLFLILLTFICSFLNLLGVNYTITNLLLFVFNLLAFGFLGFKNGIKAVNKGYLAGLKIGLLMLLILLLINLILVQKFFSLSLFIYYVIMLLTAIFGGMLGISKKRPETN